MTASVQRPAAGCAQLYERLGIEGVYQPTQRLVVVTADLVCQWLVSEGRYTHTWSGGGFVSVLSKALRQNPDNEATARGAPTWSMVVKA